MRLLQRFPGLLLLILSAPPLAAASPGDPYPWCGTEEGSELIAAARHEEFQRRLERERRAGRLPAKSAPVVYQEGQVAVLEDDGTATRAHRRFDLTGQSIQFLRRPRGMSAVRSSLGYKGLIGDKLPLGNDDTIEVDFPAGFRFPFGDGVYRSVWVNSDGNLTFGRGELFSPRDLPTFVYGLPRIAPLYADLDPSAAGEAGGVFVSFLPERVRVTWLEVPELGTTAVNTFQVTLFSTGRITFAYGDRVEAATAIVGVAPFQEEVLELLDYTAELPFRPQRTAIGERFSNEPEIDEVAAVQQFAEHFADVYTTVFIWLDFPAVTPGFAFELTLRQNVRGIGEDPFDIRYLIPGTHRLTSLVEMGDLARFPDDPDELFFYETSSTMAIVGHEFAHIWLAKARYRDADGNVSSEHLAGPHWSFQMDSEGSLMHGNDWVDNGDGTFTSTDGAHQRYSLLDRYLMGLAPAATVPDFYYIADSSDSRRYSLPVAGVTVTGRRVDVSVEDVVAAEGPRRPAYPGAPTSFRTAFLLVGVVGQGVSPEAIAKVDRYRRRWPSYFQEVTDFRGEVKTVLFPR